MTSSIRFRLTCWYVGVLAVVLAVFSVGVYGLYAASLYARLDAELTAALDVVEATLRHEIEEHSGKTAGEAAFREVLATVHQVVLSGQAVAVYDGDRLAGAKKGPAVGNTEYEFPPVRSASAGRLRHVVTEEGRRVMMRSTLVRDASTTYDLLAAAPVAPVIGELARLRGMFAWGIVVSLAVAAFCGSFLARKSLAPVVAMSESVDRITSQNLEQRVRIVNSSDELGRLGATFNRLLGRMESAFAQQRRFMADASHELRTPISIARTSAEVTLDRLERTEGEYRAALATIQKQLHRLTTVVQQMFLLARADAGAISVQKERFYLDETLQESARAAGVLGQKKGVPVSVSGLEESLCFADEALVRQSVMILLDNAVKYTPPGGSVRLQLRAVAGYYIATVTDTGPGIREEFRSRIFERFFRADESRSRNGEDFSGAGLGLAIARWVAEAHNGKLSLDSTGPEGSSFSLTLPSDRAV